ncbi:MAG TPA: hypothetical protein VFS21_15535 [Roseiflexaceae bacterium]|nr:hypothetical protein [Roseiflexaceae bacterium]
MDNGLTLRETTPEDLALLRAWIETNAGPQGATGLARHLARPRYRPDFTLLAERHGALVGYALLAHERLGLGVATLEVGRLAEVVAPDDALLGALLGEALRVLSEQGLPFVTLRGPAARFEPFGCAPVRYRARLDPAAAPDASRLRPAGPDDQETLDALYTACYAGLPLHQARAAPDWRVWLDGPLRVLLLDDRHGRVAAYAALNETALVVEAAAADAGAARTLLAALANAGAGTLALPPQHRVAQAALLLGGEVRVAAAPTDGPAELAGVVDLAGALSALAPEIARRIAGSHYAGWHGSLAIETTAERIALALTPGRVAVIEGGRSADIRLRRVTLPALAQLCLGYRPAADLRATGGLTCDDADLGLIDIVFPMLMPFE